jgi:hypothetical protein
VKTVHKELIIIIKKGYVKVVQYSFLYGMENIVWLVLKILIMIQKHRNAFNAQKDISLAGTDLNAFPV